jgi:acetylornithine deacetylase/succinyl-diaminopimelate desuccinylase-like protein
MPVLANSERSPNASLDPLGEFLRFATIAQADPKIFMDCVRWLAQHLQHIGMRRVNILTTKGKPIVVAEWLRQPGQPTVLIYGHYDVQPADPLDQWITPPFEPAFRGDYLYARGASDDKGQLFAHVCAVEYLLRDTGSLPMNVKFLIEGEEEAGSPSLSAFLQQNRNDLSADFAVVSDTCMLGMDRPAITYALRGSLDVEIEVTGQRGDLHSGNFGGAVYNPLQGLCGIVAKLHDGTGRVLIPGFYRRVRVISEAERSYMRRNGPSDSTVLAAAGAEAGPEDAGFCLYESTTIRPALSVTGITGGYQGPGPKGVIPARGLAKLNFRLVPDQDPVTIDELLRAYIAKIAPPALRVRVVTQKQTRPVVVGLQHPAIRAAAAAYSRAFGLAPVFLRSGGTVPVVDLFHRVLGIPTVLMGLALPEDNLHAPNERLHLPTFFKSIATSTHFLNEAARSPASQRRRPTMGVADRTEPTAAYQGAFV